VAAALRREIGDLPGVASLIVKPPSFGPAGRAIEVRVQHEDMQAATRAADELRDWLAGYRGVKNVIEDTRSGKDELRLSLRPGATAFGVDAESVAAQVRAGFFGVTADEVQVGPENIEIDVRLAPADRARLESFENFPVTLNDGTQIPLGVIAEVQQAHGWSRINRVGKLRTVTVYGDVDLAVTNTNQVLTDTRARFVSELTQRYPGLRLDYAGEVKEAGQTQKSIAQRFLLGLFFVFLILSFQFRSYLEPLVVMLAIPLALIGVIWGHLLLGYDLTMPSMMGFVSLAGIVVNDSILLVQVIKRRLAAGTPVREAVVHASRARFRAIFITSATTVAGLLPLLLERSVQAQILIPLVTSIVFGIATATALVLLVIPLFYTLMADFGIVRAHDPNDLSES
jgi:multidrug efflux pump subunit AcrB